VEEVLQIWHEQLIEDIHASGLSRKRMEQGGSSSFHPDGLSPCPMTPEGIVCIYEDIFNAFKKCWSKLSVSFLHSQKESMYKKNKKADLSIS